MRRHATRKHSAEQWNDDGNYPNIVTTMSMLANECSGCQVYVSEHKREYEVEDGKAHFLISLTNKTCVCGQWQVSGIPCKHGIQAILMSGSEPSSFLSELFSVKKYKVAHELPIHPIPDKEL